MNILITGATGFVASHLAEFLLHKKIGEKMDSKVDDTINDNIRDEKINDKGDVVIIDKKVDGKREDITRDDKANNKADNINIYGTMRWRSPMENIIGIKDKMKLIDMELNDFLSVRSAVEESKPDIIFHLAAQSFIPAGFSQPRNTLEVNTLGTLNLLEAVRLNECNPIVHICSTADVYGNFDRDGVVIDENSVPKPPNLYAVSKLAAEMLGMQYFQSYGIKSICSRIMNHTGPRRGANFAESSFAFQIAEIEAGMRSNVIEVGNLNSIRTFMDVRDAANAYWLLINKCKPGECYNIAGDATLPIKEVLDKLIGFSTLKDEIKVRVDTKRFRPADSFRPIVKNDKFRKATGWKPKIDFDTTLMNLLDYWRERLKREKLKSNIIPK